MRHAIFFTLIALSACSGTNGANEAAPAAQNGSDAEADANAAGFAPAAPAPAAVPVAAATAPASATAPSSPPAPATPGGLPGDRAPVSEAPFTPDSAQGAADVVQTYYALIGAGKYRQAWALWSDGGQASGMSAAAFAASFANYADYHADVGAPGDIDAGAGQRYVTVPVQAYGRLKGGAPFNLRGGVTLHRVGDIDGATAEQRSWRIRTADLKPLPGGAPLPPAATPTPAAPLRASARYDCVNGTRYTARFDNAHGVMTLASGGQDVVVMADQRPASGISYRGSSYQLRGTGNVVTLTHAGQPPLPCIAR